MNDPLEKKETLSGKKAKPLGNEEPKQKDFVNLPVTRKNKRLSVQSRNKAALFGIALVFIGLAYFLFSPISQVAPLKIPSNQTLENVAEGSTLINSDSDSGLVSKDFKVQLPKSFDGKKSRMLIWDFAAEDGDVVEVLVDGKSLGAPFMIKHKPEVFYIEVPSMLQIKGIKDGGGGITYAVYFPGGNLTYFNLAPIEGVNSYTITVQP
ncbi:hypothetical protein EHO60_08990 [Leptospira fletcheri]|uniref:Uncharacterized protein n=1 Tax=Leptospira fletcheri TaxID=2484981 RepID=A0A4V3JDW9_9LEPT|nr:hypothetical protein [Leptospira fletcheri]TGK12375.1 hypothetical protein EHO60_08990 [Leptospira fletcheri]